METITTDVTAITDIVKSLLGLFTEFPLNLILVMGIGGMAFAWIKKAKGAAK